MNIEERQLITQVFDHIRGLPPGDKDYEAERLIRENLDGLPDAPYRLVQSVLVQQQEMRRLEERVRDLEWAANLLGSPRPGAHFLTAPGAAPSANPGSVPQVDGRYAAEPRDDRMREAPASSPAPSFLTSALTTATGVAGGMLLTDGLHKLFGGGPSTGTTSQNGVLGWDRTPDALQDARADAAGARRELAEDDAALDDAQDALDTQSDGVWDFGET